MKALLYAISLLLIGFSVQAQKLNWKWENPLPQGNTIRDAHAITKNVMVMVGDAGTIIKTKDGGESWEHKRIPEKETFYAVSFESEGRGMAVGEKGVIYRTFDCGDNWEKVNSGRNDTLRDVLMISKTIVIAVGDSGKVSRSPDFGDTWVQKPILGWANTIFGAEAVLDTFGNPVGGGIFLSGSPFKDNVIEGVPYSGPPIVFSGDSGITFSPVGIGDSTLAGITVFGLNVFNIDEDEEKDKITMVGDEGLIVSTTTKGSTWETPISPVTTPLTDVWFFSEMNGFATGRDGVLLRTTDCGNTWSIVITPIQGDLLTITFPDTNTGYFGGSGGFIGKSEDGGLNWAPLGSGFRPNLRDITFLDDSFGIAVGGQGAALRRDPTTGTWDPINTGNNFPWESSAFDKSSKRTWLAGGIFGDSARIAFSDDCGDSWVPQPIFSPLKLFGIQFSDSLNGTAVGLNGVLYCTQDGGKNWVPKNSGSLSWLLDVAMPSDSVRYVSGGFGTIIRSNDFGNSWSPLTSGTQEWLTSISFLDDSFGIAVGNHNTILRTQDAGSTWTNIAPPNIASSVDYTTVRLSATKVDYFKGSGSGAYCEVYVAGFNGLILYSDDGGDSWTEMLTPTYEPIWGLYLGDSANAVAVGDRGLILRLTDSLSFDTSVVSIDPPILTPKARLGNPYPNPVQDWVKIPFHLQNYSLTRISIWDYNGRLISVLSEKYFPAGENEIHWQVPDLPNGRYILQLQTPNHLESKALILWR